MSLNANLLNTKFNNNNNKNSTHAVAHVDVSLCLFGSL